MPWTWKRTYLEKYWKGIPGSNRKCTKYFKQYLLTTLDAPLVLGLDEVDGNLHL